jgi:multiple sugar transport system permease protein
LAFSTRRFRVTVARPRPASSLESLTAWLFSAPAVLLLAVFLVLPFLMAFVFSLTDQRLIPAPQLPTEFVGLRNYQRMLEDETLLRGLRNNFVFAAVVVPVQSALALGLAMLVNQKLRGINVFRTIFFSPVATTMTVVAIVWFILYNPQQGFINAFLGFVSNGALGPYNWLDDKNLALPSIMLLSIWQGVGFQMLIFLAGLQGIPKELYEAAQIDGASPWQQFRSVTLPQLRNTTIFVLISSTILALQLFVQVYVMPLRGGPEDSTTTVIVRMVIEGFSNQRVGYASAISVAFFVIVLLISLAQRLLLREERQVRT